MLIKNKHYAYKKISIMLIKKISTMLIKNKHYASFIILDSSLDSWTISKLCFKRET